MVDKFASMNALLFTMYWLTLKISPKWQSQLIQAHYDIPSVSLVLPIASLFSEEGGIYTHADASGNDDYEHQGHVEVIYPNNAAKNFGSHCGTLAHHCFVSKSLLTAQ